mgnify:FL=1
MVLSDRDIQEEIAQGRIIIEPYSQDCIQPASVDIHLGDSMRVFRHWAQPHQVDLRRPLESNTELVYIDNTGGFSLQPHQFVLGNTMEYVSLPNDIMGRLEGKSSLGRVGLLIHSTAGYVDPGWRGHLTLELYNVAAIPIILYPGMKISQLSFHRLTSPALRPYGTPGLGSKYQGQEGPTPSRYYREFQPEAAPAPSTEVTEAIALQPLTNGRELHHWLKESQFRGSVKRFSEALGVPSKTVEGWVYRGAKPTAEHRRRLFSVTRLPQYRAEREGEARRLFRD